MGFLDKLTRKTTDKAADRAADKIVDKIFGKKKTEEAPVSQPEPVVAETAAPEEPAAREMTTEEKQMVANAQAASAESMQAAMGMAYNTKKCPECQAMCFNAPAACPYCGADLKGVAPIPPEELEKMLDKE